MKTITRFYGKIESLHSDLDYIKSLLPFFKRILKEELERAPRENCNIHEKIMRQSLERLISSVSGWKNFDLHEEKVLLEKEFDEKDFIKSTENSEVMIRVISLYKKNINKVLEILSRMATSFVLDKDVNSKKIYMKLKNKLTEEVGFKIFEVSIGDSFDERYMQPASGINGHKKGYKINYIISGLYAVRAGELLLHAEIDF